MREETPKYISAIEQFLAGQIDADRFQTIVFDLHNAIASAGDIRDEDAILGDLFLDADAYCPDDLRTDARFDIDEVELRRRAQQARDKLLELERHEAKRRDSFWRRLFPERRRSDSGDA